MEEEHRRELEEEHRRELEEEHRRELEEETRELDSNDDAQREENKTNLYNDVSESEEEEMIFKPDEDSESTEENESEVEMKCNKEMEGDDILTGVRCLGTSAKHLSVRKEADERYRQNVERMKIKYCKVKRKKLISYSCGDFVSVKIPRIDRTSTDLHRLPCVVVQVLGKKHHLYRLR